MTDDLIEKIWRDAPAERTLTEEQLQSVIEQRVHSGSRLLHSQVWTYVLIQMVTLLMTGANLVGYRSNSVMLAVQGGLALCALAFGAHAVHLHGEVRRLHRMDETLATALQRRIEFYRSTAPTWMWLAALSLVVFTFALNSLIDNAEGHYAINKPMVFVGLQVAMVLVLVASFRAVHAPHLRRAKAALADLEAQVLDQSESVERELARWKTWHMVLVALLTVLLLLGAWVAWKSGS